MYQYYSSHAPYTNIISRDKVRERIAFQPMKVSERPVMTLAIHALSHVCNVICMCNEIVDTGSKFSWNFEWHWNREAPLFILFVLPLDVGTVIFVDKQAVRGNTKLSHCKIYSNTWAREQKTLPEQTTKDHKSKMLWQYSLESWMHFQMLGHT